MTGGVNVSIVAMAVVAGLRIAAIAALSVAAAIAQGPANVLVVVNDRSALSREVGEYYARARHIPQRNVCRIKTTDAEEIGRDEYDRSVAAAIGTCLTRDRLREQVLYIVTTAGVPLKIRGSGEPLQTTAASVDSELALLYQDLKGSKHALPGPLASPLFARRNLPFRHPDFPIYLVTRLAGYDFADIRGLVDRSLEARNTGRFVLDLASADDTPGNNWLRDAYIALPRDRVIFDESSKVIEGVHDVIGYGAWGSNDKNRHKRHLGFSWLPGAIVTEFVSTNGRTFARPPDNWQIGTWADKSTWFAGSPQTLTADYVHEGVTGASGHVYEPFLSFTPRPDYLFPAYYSGRNLAESFYLSIPALSWQNIVVGDPLCSLGKPH